MKSNIPHDLKNLYRQGRLIPFMGAGVSMSVEWEVDGNPIAGPSWKALVNQAAKMLGYEEPDLLRVRGQDLQILEYFQLMNNGSFASLINWLVRTMNPPEKILKESPILSALSTISCSTFYTTNYDDFIERCFRAHGKKCRTIATEAEMGNKHDCEIVKFHGDWDHPDMMVFSESDYEKRLGFDSPMDYRLRSDILGKAVLFIGYSFRDPNVSYLFARLNEAFNKLPCSLSGKRAYILVPNPSSFERMLFNQRNIEVIPISATNITNDTANFIRDLAK